MAHANMTKNNLSKLIDQAKTFFFFDRDQAKTYSAKKKKNDQAKTSRD